MAPNRGKGYYFPHSPHARQNRIHNNCERVKTMLHRVHLFDELASEETEALTAHSSLRVYPPNAVLLNEGDVASSLYVIVEGKVKVYVSDADGKEAILNIMGPGEYFGELSLVDDEPCSASVVTLTPMRAMAITKQDFRECLKLHPEMAFNLIAALIKQVRGLTESIKNLSLNDVYGRVAHTLQELAVEKEDGTRVIEQKLTHQDIANIVGSSREMVSRILKDLTRGDYLSIENRIITIKRKLPPAW